MSARIEWTLEEDRFLRAYFDDLGDFIGTHDLGKPKGAAARRVAKLKACGAWDHLETMRQAEFAYQNCIGRAAKA